MGGFGIVVFFVKFGLVFFNFHLLATLKVTNTALLFSVEGFIPARFSGTKYLDNF